MAIPYLEKCKIKEKTVLVSCLLPPRPPQVSQNIVYAIPDILTVIASEPAPFTFYYFNKTGLLHCVA